MRRNQTSLFSPAPKPKFKNWAYSEYRDGMYVLRVVLVGLPKPVNEVWGKNRMIAYRNSQVWRKSVFYTVKGFEPQKPLTRAGISCKRFGTKFLDFDGLVGSFKPVIDGLCTIKEKVPKGLTKLQKDIYKERLGIIWTGVLADDSWAITGPWEVSQEIVPAGEERIEISVWSRPVDS